MPFMEPRQDWTEWWESRLWASAGWHDYEVILYKDETAEIAIDYASMGTPKHRYHLYGEHKKISDGHGWIVIDRIEKVTPTDTGQSPDINIHDFDGSILFEYFRVEKSPNFQHPHDMLTMAQNFGSAGWQKYFDVYLVLAPLVEEIIEGLRYAHENLSEDYEVPDFKAVEEVAVVLRMLDKSKFERIRK